MTYLRFCLLLVLVLFNGCSGKDEDALLRLENLPPEGKTRVFKDYNQVYLYFNDLSLADKNEMIRRLKDKHPLVDSLKVLLDDMIRNTFDDMLPGYFNKKDSSGR